MNASGQTALDIASFWNHDESAAFLRKHSTASPFDQAVNYYSQNPLYRASDMRKNAEWLASTAKKDSSKFIIFTVDLRPFLTKGGGKRLKLVVMSHGQLEAVMAQDPVVVFLGLETWDPHSSAWFAVKLPSGSDETVVQELSSDGYFAETFPRGRDLMMLEDTDAGLFAEANSVMQWLDRYQFCPTCGTSTKIVDGGYKRVCDNKDCRSHNG
jgi:NAD+ diphosphatase